MSHISHDIRHGLTLEQAKNVAHGALEHYVRRYAARGLKAHWSSDTRAELEFAARGLRVQAVVDVLPDVLHVDADVPLLLRAFKSVALAAVEREAQHWIAGAGATPIVR